MTPKLHLIDVVDADMSVDKSESSGPLLFSLCHLVELAVKKEGSMVDVSCSDSHALIDLLEHLLLARYVRSCYFCAQLSPSRNNHADSRPVVLRELLSEVEGFD